MRADGPVQSFTGEKREGRLNKIRLCRSAVFDFPNEVLRNVTSWNQQRPAVTSAVGMLFSLFVFVHAHACIRSV